MKAYLIQIFLFRMVQLLLFRYIFLTGNKFFVIEMNSERSLIQLMQLGIVLVVQLSVFILMMKKKYLRLYLKWVKQIKISLSPIIGIGTLVIPVGLYFYYVNHYTGQYNGFNFHNMIVHIVFFLSGALAEEMIFRGFFFKYMIKKHRKFALLLIVMQALFFSLTHLLSPEFSVIMIINIFLAGMLLGMIAVRGFVYAVLFHFLWNFLQGYFLGISVSGYAFTGTMNKLFDAPQWENNIYSAVLVGLVLILYLGIYFKNKKQFV